MRMFGGRRLSGCGDAEGVRATGTGMGESAEEDGGGDGDLPRRGTLAERERSLVVRRTKRLGC